MSSNKPNILYIIHAWNIKDGGTTLHTMDLISKLNGIFNFHVFCIEGSVYKVYSYIEGKEYITAYPRYLFNANYVIYKNNDYRDLLNEILDDFGISFVHIQHTYGAHFFDIYDVLKKKNIKYAITLHDYYCMCPLLNKMYLKKKYCGINPSIELCSKCCKKIIGNNFDINEWRNQFHNLLSNAKYVIAPSESLKNEINIIYKDVKIIVIEHGVNIKKFESNIKLEKVNDIAFVGFLTAIKGVDILKYLIRNKNRDYKIHLFGFSTMLLPPNSNNWINHGKYKREEISYLLHKNNIKLVCLLSVCPETYSYTLTESIAAGIPVLSYDIGALGQRIKKDNLGWIINLDNNFEEVNKKIVNILKDKKQYKEKILSINKYKIKSVNEMCEEYKKIYENEIKSYELNIENIVKKSKENNKYLKYKSFYDNRYMEYGLRCVFATLPSDWKTKIVKSKEKKMKAKFSRM